MFSHLVKRPLAFTKQSLQAGDIFLGQTKSMMLGFLASGDFETKFAHLCRQLMKQLVPLTLGFFSQFLRFHNFIL